MSDSGELERHCFKEALGVRHDIERNKNGFYIMKKDYTILKEQHHWTSEKKIKWMGYGEWVEEADVVEFDYLGYQGRIVRVLKREPYAVKEAYFGGHLCGYVKVPEAHPLFGKKQECWDVDLKCHGGITYSEAHEEHWIGFDCGHSGDYVPSIYHLKKQRESAGELNPFPLPPGYQKFALFNPVYRNMQYAIESCTDLIDSLQCIYK